MIAMEKSLQEDRFCTSCSLSWNCTEGYEEDSIFEIKERELYGLRDCVEFHLYINTSPCGDARIFSPHEQVSGKGDKHPGRKKKRRLQVKLENVEGLSTFLCCIKF